MPTSKNKALDGPQTSDRTFRTDESFRWAGAVPDGDRLSMQGNQFRLLVNVRNRNGLWRRRGGQDRALTAPLDGAASAVRSLADFQIGTRRSLFFCGDGCPGVSAGVGAYLGWFDQEQDPQFQPGVYYSGAAADLHIEPFGANLFIVNDQALRRFQVVNGAWGQNALGVSGSSQDIPLVSWTTYVGGVARSFDAQLFMSLQNGVGLSRIGVWDDTTFWDDDLTAINPVTGMMRFRDEKLIAGFGGTPNSIRTRLAGSHGQAWGTVNASVAGFAFYDGAMCRDNAYITTGLDNIVWRYTGTALAPFRTIANATRCNGICEDAGNLYVAYGAGPVATGQAWIAKYDGATNTWNETFKNLSAQLAAAKEARRICVFRSSLCVTCFCTPGQPVQLFMSPPDNFAGTYVITNPGGGGDINQLLVY